MALKDGGELQAEAWSAAEPQTAVATAATVDSSVVLPDGLAPALADMARAGPDLMLTWPDGESVIVPAYFTTAPPAPLTSSGGSWISGETVMALAGPSAPSQVAQANLLAQAPVASSPERIGTVENTDGSVFVTRVDGSRSELDVGDPVFQGDVLETASDGAVGVVLADETTFSMGENGRMVMDELIYDPSAGDGSIQLSLIQGVMTFVSGEIAKADPDALTIQTPVATIGIRGTQIGIDMSDGETLRIVLMEESDGFVGEVVVSTSGGVVVLNDPYHFTTVSDAGLPPTPVSVLDHDDLLEIFGGALRHLPLRFGRENDYGTQTGEDAADAAGFETAAGPGTETETTLPFIQVVVNPYTPVSGIGNLPEPPEVVTVFEVDREADASPAERDQPIEELIVDVDVAADETTPPQAPLGFTLEAGDSTDDLVVVGSDGDDVIITGSGNDLIDAGGAGNDFVDSGAGNDVVIAGPGSGSDTYIGGAGIDVLSYLGVSDGITVDLVAFLVNDANNPFGVNPGDRIGQGEDADGLGGGIGFDILHGFEKVIAGDGNDTVIGDGSANWIDGSGGNDTLIGGAGADHLIGGEGDDVLVGGTQDDELYGGAGDDVFVYNDGDGTDYFNGGEGNDTLLGGDGDDTIRLRDFGVTNDVEVIDGGGGSNVLSVAGRVGDFSATELLNIARIEGGNRDSTLTGSSGDDTLIGGGGRDTLNGGEGDDVFLYTNGDGVDVVIGGAGSDTLLGSDGDDVFRLQDFNPANSVETIDGGGGTNTVFVAGRVGDFSATELFNIARIEGGNRDSTLVGTSGDDTLIGGGGRDTLNGGEGDDVFLYTNGDGVDVVIGGAGSDTLLGSDGDDTIRLQEFNAANGVETIDGGGGTNTVFVAGRVGDFSATELENIDELRNGNAFGTLIGTDGNDRLAGGGGDDTLIGGGGDDVFLFGAGDGFDIIFDFNLGDVLRLDGSDFALDQVGIESDGASSSIVTIGDGDDSVVLSGVDADRLVAYTSTNDGTNDVLVGFRLDA